MKAAEKFRSALTRNKLKKLVRVRAWSGADLCDFARISASNRRNGFLYNQEVRVRKEDHVWSGRFGSDRCEL